VIVLNPESAPSVLPPTCPLIGVFDDQHHLFHQEHVELQAGSLLVATSDGITESRNRHGDLFGIERLMACVVEHRNKKPTEILDAIVETVSEFSGCTWDDDVAVLVARFA